VNGSNVAGATNQTFSLAPANHGDRGDLITVAVTADDNHGGSDSMTSPAVTVANSRPVGQSQSVATGQGNAQQITLTATDVDGDALTFSIGSGPSHGSLTPNTPPAATCSTTSGVSTCTSTITYTPTPAFFSPPNDGFSFQAHDGGLVSQATTVTITVNQPNQNNHPPVVRSVSINQTSPRTNDTLNLTRDVTDLDGDSLALSYEWLKDGAVIPGANGPTLDLSQPGNGDKGNQIVVVLTADDGFLTATKTSAPVTILNSAPKTIARAYKTTRNQLITINGTSGVNGVLGKDSDADNDPLSVVAPTTVKAGIGSLHLNPNGDGSFTYAPPIDLCNGSTRFTYKATDGTAQTAGTASITIYTLRKPTTISLAKSSGLVGYQQAVALRAHLGAHSRRALISIFSKPLGGQAILIARRAPNSSGNVVLTVHPSKRTSYFARSSDNCFKTVTTSSQTVAVRARVVGWMTGFFRTTRGIHLYHRAAKPVFHGSVIPDHTGKNVRFEWQRLANRRWHRYFSTGVPLGGGSRMSVALTQGVLPGVNYRLRIVWGGDAVSAANVSSWQNFRVMR